MYCIISSVNMQYTTDNLNVLLNSQHLFQILLDSHKSEKKQDCCGLNLRPFFIINNVEENVVFLGLKVLRSDKSNICY